MVGITPSNTHHLQKRIPLIINTLHSKTHENTGNKPAIPEINNKPNMTRHHHKPPAHKHHSTPHHKINLAITKHNNVIATQCTYTHYLCTL